MHEQERAAPAQKELEEEQSSFANKIAEAKRFHQRSLGEAERGRAEVEKARKEMEAALSAARRSSVATQDQPMRQRPPPAATVAAPPPGAPLQVE